MAKTTGINIKGEGKNKIKELQRRINIIQEERWNELTYEMVYEKPYVTKVSSNIRKRAEKLLEKGLISKSFNNLRNEEKEDRRVKINGETIDKLKELHPQRNT